MSLLASHRLLLLIVLPSSTSALRVLYNEQEDPSVLDPAFEYVSLEKTNGTEASESHWHGVRIAAVGWKKTGTTSMNKAYSLLGMKPVGGVNRCRTPSCMHHFAAVEDAYACCNHGLVKAMKHKYTAKKLKFVLTERKPEKWRSSVNAWLKKGKKKHLKPMYGQLMGAKFGSKEFYEKYEKHNQFIKELFKDEPDRLLVLNLEEDNPTQNMQKFCRFVDIDPAQNPKCNEPFPHANSNHHSRPAFEQIQDTEWDWDDNEDELDGYEPQWATFDWMKWYESKGLDLKSDIIFHADKAN